MIIFCIASPSAVVASSSVSYAHSLSFLLCACICVYFFSVSFFSLCIFVVILFISILCRSFFLLFTSLARESLSMFNIALIFKVIFFHLCYCILHSYTLNAMLSMHKLAKRSLQFQLKINDNFNSIQIKWLKWWPDNDDIFIEKNSIDFAACAWLWIWLSFYIDC